MRRSILAVAAVVGALLAAPVTLAAPTCLDGAGSTIRCGTTGAMPVGWTPSPEQLSDRESASSPGPSLSEAVAMIYVVGAIFALIALMPPFDGRDGGDWDEQEGDGRKAR